MSDEFLVVEKPYAKYGKISYINVSKIERIIPQPDGLVDIFLTGMTLCEHKILDIVSVHQMVDNLLHENDKKETTHE